MADSSFSSLIPPLASSFLRSVSILGTGSHTPSKILTNNDLEKMVETSDEWIVTRTGIKERRIAQENEKTSDLGTEACKKALQDAGIGPTEVDMIICGTMTPDMACPSTACLIQKNLGANRAICFDVSAACSGFLYPLEIARKFVETGSCNNVLVVGAEKISTIMDWNDRSTCVLFGDGAGAAVLGHRPDATGIIASHLESAGTYADILCMGAPLPSEKPSPNNTVLKMNGRETYKKAVPAMVTSSQKVLEKAGVPLDAVKMIIPHQANQRIIEAVASRLDLPLEKFFLNLEHYGNTSAAAISIALDEAAHSHQFERGDLLLLVTFGGGLAWGAMLLEW